MIVVLVGAHRQAAELVELDINLWEVFDTSLEAADVDIDIVLGHASGADANVEVVTIAWQAIF